MRVIKHKRGGIILSRRTKTFNLEDYGPCANREEWICLKTAITNHQKSCPAKDDSQYSKGLTVIQTFLMIGKVSETGSQMLRSGVAFYEKGLHCFISF